MRLSNVWNCCYSLDDFADLKQLCKTNIYLQKTILIQPKTRQILRNYDKSFQIFDCLVTLVAPCRSRVSWPESNQRGHSKSAPGCHNCQTWIYSFSILTLRMCRSRDRYFAFFQRNLYCNAAGEPRAGRQRKRPIRMDSRRRTHGSRRFNGT